MPRVPKAVCSTPDSTPDTLSPPTSGDAQPWLSTAAHVVDAKYPGPDCFHTTKVAPPQGDRLTRALPPSVHASHPWTSHPLEAFVDFLDATPESSLRGIAGTKQMVGGR